MKTSGDECCLQAAVFGDVLAYLKAQMALTGVSFSSVVACLRCLPAPGVPLVRTAVGADERDLFTAMRSFFFAAGLAFGSGWVFAWTFTWRVVLSLSMLGGGSILETVFSLFLTRGEAEGFSTLLFESTCCEQGCYADRRLTRM